MSTPALIAAPAPIGSYDADDVTFLLKDVSEARLERPRAERERLMQGGGHYSETLPTEYSPTAAYRELFEKLLEEKAHEVAALTAALADIVVEYRGDRVVIASLARAGTPVGVLLRRAIRARHGIDAPHYSVSIIRDRGIDPVAIAYLLQRHRAEEIQFLDGWTGKGVIARELAAALGPFRERGVMLDPELAVLADPGHCTTLFSTRRDVLVPSACLNSTVSGLVSRTVLNAELIGPGDFHGAKWYRELSGDDVSRRYVDTISALLGDVDGDVRALRATAATEPAPDWQGMADVLAIQRDHGLDDVNLVKPGIGETTRVLLRRVPWKVLVNEDFADELSHVRLLARDRGVPLEPRPGMAYACCGLIEPIAGRP